MCSQLCKTTGTTKRGDSQNRMCHTQGAVLGQEAPLRYRWTTESPSHLTVIQHHQQLELFSPQTRVCTFPIFPKDKAKPSLMVSGLFGLVFFLGFFPPLCFVCGCCAAFCFLIQRKSPSTAPADSGFLSNNKGAAGWAPSNAFPTALKRTAKEEKWDV